MKYMDSFSFPYCTEEIHCQCVELIRGVYPMYDKISKFICKAYWNKANAVAQEGHELLSSFDKAVNEIRTRPFSYNGETEYLYESVNRMERVIIPYKRKFELFIKNWNVV